MSKDMVNMHGKEDPFYRYTMPRLQIKVEGSTKMIKTVLCNIEAVAQCVGRPVDYLVTYYGQELCVASKIESLKAYVTGKVEQEQLQEATFKFINGYVMCGSCHNPETTPSVMGSKKKQYIELTCKGCGAKTPLDALDKFVKYMVTHPIEGAAAGPAKEKKKKKKDKKEGSDADDSASDSDEEKPVEKTKKKKGKDADSLGVGVVGELDKMADEAAAAAAAAKKEKKKKKDKSSKAAGGGAAAVKEEDSDSDWAVDVSAEAVAKRAAESEVGSVAAIAAKASAVSISGGGAAKAAPAPAPAPAPVRAPAPAPAAAAKSESSEEEEESDGSLDLDNL